jgi:hypothetical protein
MTLLQKQKKFASYAAQLIQHIEAAGYNVTLGRARTEGDPRCHGMSLAIDLNLFDGDKYLTDTKAHQAFGEWWEALDPDCRWGGRFDDGNHYSITHNGKA